MIRVEPFKKHHYREIVKLTDQNHLIDIVTDEDLESVESNPYSKTVFYGDKILLVGGIVLSAEHRGEAWGIVAKGNRQHFIALHRTVKKFLGGARLRRIEAIVHNDYEPGHRWVKTLGFKLEASCMKSYAVDGTDASLYALVEGGSNGG